MTPLDANIVFENVSFLSSDGLRLAGWFIPGKRARAVVIVCHGYTSSRDHLLNTISFLHRAGFDVLAFDFRAHGESEGVICTFGKNEVNDLTGAVRYIQSRESTQSNLIGVMGFSMGAATCLMTAPHEPSIAAVVADSPFARLDRTVDHNFAKIMGPFAWLLELPVCVIGQRLQGIRPRDVSPISDIASISPRPLLLIHGTADSVIRHEDSKTLFDAAREPKSLWLVDGAEHVQAHAAAGEAYEKRVVTFFRESLKPNSKNKRDLVSQ